MNYNTLGSLVRKNNYLEIEAFYYCLSSKALFLCIRLKIYHSSHKKKAFTFIWRIDLQEVIIFIKKNYFSL